MACMTRIIDDFSLAAAFRTGLLHREKPLLHAHLAGAVTGRTLNRARSPPGAAAGAGAAGYQLGHPNLDCCAGYGILKVHFQVVTQVRPGLPALATAPLRAENIAENTVEYVAEPAESLGIRATGRGTGRRHGPNWS